MRISDWSSDVCSSDLLVGKKVLEVEAAGHEARCQRRAADLGHREGLGHDGALDQTAVCRQREQRLRAGQPQKPPGQPGDDLRSVAVAPLAESDRPTAVFSRMAAHHLPATTWWAILFV